MRKPLIAGNWKMNNTIDQSIDLARKLVEFSRNFDKHRDILIIAPFTALHAVKEVIKDSSVMLGAQNMYYEEKGAFTGEISPLMLKDIGVDYVLIGHSERRQFFHEDDELLNKKLKTALKFTINPILCVGETLEQREQGLAKETVKNQLVNGLKDINITDMGHITIAYEPVWAIGTGKTATSDEAEEIIAYIRSIIMELYNKEVSEGTIIQYGGSVKGSNIKEIMTKPNIDGALVGGASLKADEFIQIINY